MPVWGSTWAKRRRRYKPLVTQVACKEGRQREHAHSMP